MIKLHNQVSFSKEIERRATESDCGFIEAIVDYCQETGMEIEAVNKLLTAHLKEKIRDEAQKLNFLEKKGNKLDFLD